MPPDPRAVCVVGVAQATHRGPEAAPEPLDSWAQVAGLAAVDSGAPEILQSLDSVQIVYCQTWPYDDPVERLVERLGIAPRHRHYSGVGGTTPQILIGQTASRMARGELDSALIVGAEALATLRSAKRAGERLAWSHRSTEKKPFPFEVMPDAAEIDHGVYQAWETFPLFDTARRAARGEELDDYAAGIGAMMAPMTEVAAVNPYAWRREPHTAADLATATPANRYVGWPYTKSEVAVMDVDMAAAVIVCTSAAADRLGVPADKRVWLSGWAAANDPFAIAARADMSRSAAMSAVFDGALASAGVAVEEVTDLDVYSCFPSSLLFACDALGLDPLDPRGLTVTGGLPFAGGPASNYLLHAVAAMTQRLRDNGGTGLVTGVGMHMAKHVAAVYAAEPPGAPPSDPGTTAQQTADTQAVRPLLAGVDGEGDVVAYTVAHGRDGSPAQGLVVVETGDGRALARVSDASLLSDMESRELVGEHVHLRADGEVNTATW